MKQYDLTDEFWVTEMGKPEAQVTIDENTLRYLYRLVRDSRYEHAMGKFPRTAEYERELAEKLRAVCEDMGKGV